LNKLFFILLFISSSSVSAQSEEDIVELKSLLQNDMPVVENIAQDLMRVYSPEKYLYVMIGSSPAVLQAHFAGVYPDVDIVNIPLSGLGGGYLYGPDPDLNLERAVIQQRLQDFTSDKLGADKVGIVLIDYVNTGRTLLRTLNVARFFLHHKHVVTYALFRNEAQKLEWEKYGRRGIVVGTSSFGLNVHKTKYSPWAEYLSVDYRKDQIVKNTWYSALVAEMSKLRKGSQAPQSCALIF
jgi:hypothetical protein